MRFRDRSDAATQLAAALAGFRGKNPLVLAIPRGAVPMGKVLADKLQGELDIVLVRKLPAPGSPEFAVGAVDESGWAYIAPYAREVGADAGYLEQEKARQMATLHAVRARKPARLVCAVPVAAPDSLEKVRAYADEVVCLATPPEFHAVSQFYSSFPQVEDEEVMRLLA